VKVLVALILLAVIGAAVFFFSGTYNVAASNPDPPLKHWLLSTVSDASVQRHSRDISVPTLGGPDQLRLGFHHYDEMCAICHGSPGAKPSELTQGLNPRAPKFSRGTDLSPRELFWVTKNGIQMTGMPAWGPTHSDEEIWAIVAFIPQLSKLTPAQYQAMQREQPPPR
jgi:mono/diheme cytochrome c family protein